MGSHGSRICARVLRVSGVRCGVAELVKGGKLLGGGRFGGRFVLGELVNKSLVSLLVASDDESLLEEDSEDEDDEDDEEDGVEEIEIVSLGAASFSKTVSSSMSASISS